MCTAAMCKHGPAVGGMLGAPFLVVDIALFPCACTGMPPVLTHKSLADECVKSVMSATTVEPV